jgi:hypothetical protein
MIFILRNVHINGRSICFAIFYLVSIFLFISDTVFMYSLERKIVKILKIIKGSKWIKEKTSLLDPVHAETWVRYSWWVGCSLHEENAYSWRTVHWASCRSRVKMGIGWTSGPRQIWAWLLLGHAGTGIRPPVNETKKRRK